MHPPPDLGPTDWFAGRRVFLTGHTGFKGAWMAAWLQRLGADVHGYALPPDGTPNLFVAADIGRGMRSTLADIRDRDALEVAMRSSAPEIVIHMAAQALVRRSYRDPIGTYAANVMGTVHVLEAARRVPSVRAIVVVTSDKCYENRGFTRGYTEDDAMGGDDPYSSSKGCAELVTSAFRHSFFRDGIALVASARAGNVIGGGDWAEDRLIPDLMRAAQAGTVAVVRNPEFVRPWQFVLEPVHGYLTLVRALVEEGSSFAEAWNFGPNDSDAVPVRAVVEHIRRRWTRVTTNDYRSAADPPEARHLLLDCTKARQRLRWAPVLRLDDAVDMTVSWYRDYYDDPTAARNLVHRDLDTYTTRLRQSGEQR